jgi:hypothetical protein
LRCYDYTYEQSHNGHPSNDVYDTAYLTAELPAYTLGSDQHIQARLMKVTTIDGYTIHNGYWSPDNWGIGFTNGVIWVNSQEFDYYDWMGGSVNFQYDLSWDRIFYGYDQYPNWWSPEDFANDWGGFAGHTIEVSFAIEWWQQNWWGGWDKIGGYGIDVVVQD